MPRYLVLALLAIALAATAAAAPAPPAHLWEIGPIIRGKNYSAGMPFSPMDSREGWYFEFPYPNARAGHAHYLTFRHGSLAGKKRIVMRYRVDAAPGVRIVPRERPDLPATLTLYFQRAGDSWKARGGGGAHEAYRWYAPVHTVVDLTPGKHVVSARLDDPKWAAVMTSFSGTNPVAFREAVLNAERVGFVLGSRQGGYGHGVYATGPARLTVLSFEVL